MKTETQTLKIQRWLAQGHALTPLDALKRFNCFRLGARCWELKQQGWPIQKRMVTVQSGSRVAEYRFETRKKS
jgi:hypothetical protein